MTMQDLLNLLNPVAVDSSGLPVAPGQATGTQGSRSLNNIISQGNVQRQTNAFNAAEPIRARTAERRKRQIIANQNRLIRTTSMGASVRDMTLGGEVLLATR
jgi:hypothetical protein